MPGWPTQLPTTPPQASLYPHAEIMHDSTDMVDILYGMCMSGGDVSVVQYEKSKKGPDSSCHLADGKTHGFGCRQEIYVYGQHIPSCLQVLLDADTFQATWRQQMGIRVILGQSSLRAVSSNRNIQEMSCSAEGQNTLQVWLRT